MADDALAQARAMLAELTEAAKKGAIIPIRLPGQLEAILNTIEQAQEEAAAPPAAGGDSGGVEAFKEQFATLLSHGFHDLRLPLTSIRGYSDMLVSPGMGELSEMQKQFLSTVRVNARRMETLLMDVSDLSKIHTGTLKMTPKMDMFKNIALMVEKAMKPLVEELNRTLTFDVPQGLPFLNLDGEILAKALSKLTENALRYAEPDSGEVKVSASGEGGKLVITIQDNGIGMTPEEIARLGEPYFRGDNEIILSYKGSGLGIPIAYNIIELMGGSVTVESEPGKGTIFTVALPGMS